MVEHAKRIAEWVAEVHGSSQDDDFEAIVEYILQATKDPELMRHIYQYVEEKKQDDVPRFADWLREEGEIYGTATLLLRLLGQRFGTVPREIQNRVRRGKLPELERWASHLLVVASLDEIFAEPDAPPPS